MPTGLDGVSGLPVRLRAVLESEQNCGLAMAKTSLRVILVTDRQLEKNLV